MKAFGPGQTASDISLTCMLEFRRMPGTVYILENAAAQRVKVGVTINAAGGRLRDVNDMWLGRKGTCQVCGRRVVLVRGRVPRHAAGVPEFVVGVAGCAGTHNQPLEQSSDVAQKHLAALKNRVGGLTGVRKGSVTRMIATLERRISAPRHHDNSSGLWQVHTTYLTESPETVERLAHSLLAEFLDHAAPIGEVFRCSVSQAIEAVENALSQLGLDQSARKETQP